MGSDGLWDVINKQELETEIKDLIKLANNSQRDISEVISKFAEDRWKQTWTINHDQTTFEYTMTHPEQWDDIVVCYLESEKNNIYFINNYKCIIRYNY